MNFKDWAQSLVDGANIIIIPLLFAIAFLSFVWGILKYFFLNPDSEEERRQGKQFILWGILGMVLLFSVWGVVYILLDTLGFAAA
ncbi:hypothetical protein A3C95_00660 [Candidatus Kaiserbacteria bacterium RIFCSPHIGHO2_02_FULL_56_30]|uniref:Uncharacterized protein n=1 Tax=Candidatus Kaiserbacteria bacterium RIFCSPHIGHO2_02_FULL_56_30 TaxID=1798499 RepID=A0A1F6E5I5_9BACT|nr:MAG: hypothetical protein A3C95_00660 [Candidatus Kaiserbacteria bacterium RIFCSPHIGHO2_02_FULL_56_30]